MPTAVASMPPPVPPVAPPFSPPVSQQSPTSDTAFGAILAQTTQASQATGTSADEVAAFGSGIDDNQRDHTKDETQAAAQAAAGLLVVGPGIVLSSSGSPVNVANAASTAASSTTGQTAAAAEVQSRADQFRLRLAVAPQSLPQGAALLPTAATMAAAAATAPQTTAPARQLTNTNETAVNTAAIPGTPANPLVTPATAQTPITATGLPAGQTPVIPAQAPIVTNLIPPTPAPPLPVDTQQTVVATSATAALPDVQIGDRPAMSGEKFAAIVADADRLKTTAAPAQAGPFAGVLAATHAAISAPGASTPAVATVVASPASAAAAVSVAPASVVVTSAVPLPDGLGLNASLTSGSDQFILSGVEGRASNTGNGMPTTFADVLRNRNSDTTAAMQSATATVTAGTIVPTPPSVAQAAAATQAQAAATPTQAAQVADTVVAHAQTLEKGGTSEFQMRLDPPELGRVNVRLISDGDSIRGQVIVANDSVRQMIESQLPELRQRLEQAGVTVGQFNVATDPNSGGNGSAYRGSSPFDIAPTAAAASPAARPQSRPADRSVAGRIDVTV